jgi:hypothetical protein
MACLGIAGGCDAWTGLVDLSIVALIDAGESVQPQFRLESNDFMFGGVLIFNPRECAPKKFQPVSAVARHVLGCRMSELQTRGALLAATDG